jgi:nucleotide-binding universal stress UspA family protein
MSEVGDEDFREILDQTRHFVRTAVVPREQEILAADRVPDDLSITTRLLDGDPAREILGAAVANDHDVIVLGSRGRGRMTAALLGSVSNRVMHDAEVPVIVIHRPRNNGPDLAA